MLAHQLRFEPLEERCLLAVLMVNSDLDNTTPGDELVTLREALDAANNDSTTDLGQTGNGADEIVFDSSLAGKTILLGGTQLEITSNLKLMGLGADNLAIDANEMSRVMRIASGATVEINDLTITGGIISTNSLALGGGLLNSGTTTLRHVKIVDNSVRAIGSGAVAASGGGIANTGHLTIEDSLVSGNMAMSQSSSANAYSDGGGIHSAPPDSNPSPFFPSLTIIRSTISANTATNTSISFQGSKSRGGGIFSGSTSSNSNSLTIQDSVISNNVASSSDGFGNRESSGGGIRATGPVEIGGTAIYGNSATSSTNGQWSRSDGGGISFARNPSNFPSAHLNIIRSTISGNSVSNSGGDSTSYSRGGGISIDGAADITLSTISANSAPANQGSGVVVKATTSNDKATFWSSIVYDNANSDVDDLGQILFSSRVASMGYNIIGTGNVLEFFTASGDRAGTTDPLLDELRDNGGLSLTHALLPGSPAIDAGDPSIPANPNDFDQRGAPFVRVYNGDGVGGARIDIGAFEFQPNTAIPELLGDYNRDRVVDAADYTVWRNSFGQGGLTPYDGADGSGNGEVGQEDYAVWKSHFGESLPAGTGSAGGAASGPVAESLSSPGVPLASRQFAFMDGETLDPSTSIRPLKARHRNSVHRQTDAGLLAWLAARHAADRNVSLTDQCASADHADSTLASTDDGFAAFESLSIAKLR